MTKEYLKSYRVWLNEIQKLTQEIERARTHDAVLSSAEFPYSQHTKQKIEQAQKAGRRLFWTKNVAASAA